jgi:transposase-like protein
MRRYGPFQGPPKGVMFLFQQANAFPGRGNVAPYDKERFDLKKELARVTRERDILKKALGYFASQKE